MLMIFKHDFFKVAFQLWNTLIYPFLIDIILVTSQPFVVKLQKLHQENTSCETYVCQALDDSKNVYAKFQLVKF